MAGDEFSMACQLRWQEGVQIYPPISIDYWWWWWWWWWSSSSSPPSIIHPYSDIVPSIYYEYYIYTYYYTLIMIIMISLYTILPLSSLSHTLLVLDHPTPNATFRLRHRRSRGPSAAATPGRSLRTSSRAAAVEGNSRDGRSYRCCPPPGLINWVGMINTNLTLHMKQ